MPFVLLASALSKREAKWQAIFSFRYWFAVRNLNSVTVPRKPKLLVLLAIYPIMVT